MSAQSKAPEEAGGPRREVTQYRWLRLERVRALTHGRLAENVCDALAAEWERGGQKPERILFRRTFARRARQLDDGRWSDRKLPPKQDRPPATRLVAPKGSALETYLTCLFVAQCTTPPGKKPKPRRVTPLASDSNGPTPWADLLAMPATTGTGKRFYATAADNRIRQIATTLRRLAADDVRLLDFPHAAASKGKYEEFRILSEEGNLGRASRVAYAVPVSAEEMFSLPREFFTNGWHLVLSDSEMAMLLALYARRGAATPWSADELYGITAENRIRLYGLAPSAYATHRELEAFGILHVVSDDRRRENGTFEEFDKGAPPVPNTFRVLEDGFGRPAIPAVMTGLKQLGVRKPTLGAPAA